MPQCMYIDCLALASKECLVATAEGDIVWTLACDEHAGDSVRSLPLEADGRYKLHAMPDERPPPERPIVTFVGEDNPYGADPEFALYPRPDGCSGHRLCDKILGLGEHHYLASWIKRVNLCGDAWDLRVARLRAGELIDHPPSTVIVALGARVRDALMVALRDRRLQPDLATWHFRSVTLATGDDIWIYSIPHPSGRNLVWNDAARISETRRALRWLAPAIPWGEP